MSAVQACHRPWLSSLVLKILESAKLSKNQLDDLLLRSPINNKAIYRSCSEIITSVQKKGIEALRYYTKKFDGFEAKSEKDFIAQDIEFQEAEQSLAENVKSAFNLAAKNIAHFHRFQKKQLKNKKCKVMGSHLGYRYLPIEKAGIYAPGGLASYPSSVLMGLIPAKIAGVEERILITPPSKQGKINPAVLYCAKIAGASSVLKIGGAQGIAASAYGIIAPKVNIIVGPGNSYVTASKMLLASQGILAVDLPAGPSEVLVIADESARPDFVAADMLSQAEHGADSCAVLLCLSKKFAQEVSKEISCGIKNRKKRSNLKQSSIKKHSFALVFEEWNALYDFANEYGAEHLELCLKNPKKALPRIKSAGSIFMGHYAPVALGDYCSGSNHILPTGGSARFYSGLGIDSFLKRITYQFPSKKSLNRVQKAIAIMSEQEGLEEEHGHSIKIRFSDRKR